MRVLSPVVQVSAGPVPCLGRDLAVRDTVTAKAIGDDAAGLELDTSQQALEEALRCRGVPPLLHQDVEHDPVLVHCAPEIAQHAVDSQEYFIEMPGGARLGPTSPELAGELSAELEAPPPHTLAGDDDALLSQDQLHVAPAQAEDVTKPDGVADDLRREAVAGVGRGLWRHWTSVARPTCSGQSPLTCQFPSHASAPPGSWMGHRLKRARYSAECL